MPTHATATPLILGATGAPGIYTGAFDPSSVGQAAAIASLFLRTDTGTAYTKTGAADTDWTAVGAGGSTMINDPWGMPENPHAANDEFEGPTLDPSWSQTGFSSALNFGTRPNAYATPGVNAASFENRRGPDNSGNNSWLRIQPAASRAGIWKSTDFGAGVPTNLLAWSRIDFGYRSGVTAGTGDDVALWFFEDTGAGFSASNYAAIFLSNSTLTGGTNERHALFVVRNTLDGVTTVVREFAPMQSGASSLGLYAPFSGYVALQKVGTTYYAWLIDDGGRVFMGEATSRAVGGPGPTATNAVALTCQVAGGGVPGIMYYDFDFIRFYEGADWVP